MQAEEYSNIYQLENQHWWYLGLDDFLKKQSQSFSIGQDDPILDIGCGTGGRLASLPYTNKRGFDLSPLAINFAKTRNIALYRANVESIPFKSNAFKFIYSFDVLYHLNVKSITQALSECYRILKPEGYFLIQLPAFNFLHSSHDELVHTRQRFRKKEVTQHLEEAKFKIISSGYRNFFLFPIAAAMRLLTKKNQQSASSDVKPQNPFINSTLFNLLKFENNIIKNGINFPFGLSVYCLAQK